MYVDPYSMPISGQHHFANNGFIENQSTSGSMSIEGSISNASIFDDAYLNMTSEETYIFDRTDVRVIFITLHTLVFCCCFFGNLLVILVVTLSRRLRSITNFFLANLAVADFCVGIFCVFQNLSIYLIHSWVLGDFLCKMSQFVHSMSYTASIFILVVICTERYFAIIHPITCKQILTPTRLRLVIAAVWITSALYSAPKLIWVQIITNPLPDGRKETICIPHRKKYNSELFDMINFALLYVTPLLVMTILYTRIAVGLWRSSRGLERHMALTAVNNGHCNNGTICRRLSSRHEKRNVTVTAETRVTKLDKTSPTGPSPAEGTSTCRPRPRANSYNQSARQSYHMSHSSQNVLRARRGVIRMLIIVVLTFAICNLPFHARKMWQYWSTDYQGDSNFSTLFTPLTFLITYFNSGVNPLLYAFLSRNFRKGMRELLLCSFRSSKKKKSKQNLLNPHALQQPQSSILRVSSTRSNTTKAINCSTTLTMGDGLKS